MKRLLILLGILFALPAFGQGQRFGDPWPVTSTQTPGGPIYNVPNATINWCNFPANGVPCTNKATTYTDITITTPCSTATQVTLAGSSSCVATTDSYGNWGVWVAAGTYAFTITIPNGNSIGPFTVTLTASGGVFTGGTVPNPTTFSSLLTLPAGMTSSGPNTLNGVTTVGVTGNVTLKSNCTGTTLGGDDYIRYASRNGSDSNDGCSWGSAKATVDGALISLPAGASNTWGVGTVYFSDQTPANSSGAHGLWGLGITDSNYASPPAGWFKISGPIEVIGMAAFNGATGSTQPKARLLGGSNSGTSAPCIQISGDANVMTFRNINCQGQGVGIRLGQDSSGTRTGSAGVSGKSFLNVGACPNNIAGNGPGIDNVGNMFWVIYRDISACGTDNVNTATANASQAMLFDGSTAVNGFTQMFLENIALYEGSIKLVAGSAGYESIDIQHVQSEGQTGPAAVWMSNQWNSVKVEDIVANDPVGTSCYGAVCAVENDGAGPSENVLLTAPVDSGSSPVTKGPMLMLGASQQKFGGINYVNGVEGLVNTYDFSNTDAARRQAGAVTVLHANSAVTLPTGWTSTTGSVTTGITDKDGGTNAGRLSNGASQGFTYFYPLTGSVAVAAGDIMYGGVWERTNSGTGSGTPQINITSCTGVTYVTPGFSSTPVASNQAPTNGEWFWNSVIVKIAGVTGTCTLAFYGNSPANSAIDYYAPIFIRLPTGTVPDSEAMMEFHNLIPYSNTCTVGQLCTVTGPFAYVPSTLTAKVIPQASATFPFLTNSSPQLDNITANTLTYAGSGGIVAPNLTSSALTSGNCVQAGSGGILGTVSGPCSTGGTVNNPNGSFTQGETLAAANSTTGAYSSPAVIYASTYTGSDKCAILTAAMSAATSLGGTVVVGDFPPNANYTCASGFTVTPGIWLQLGNYTLTLGGTVTVNSQGRLTGTQNGSTSNVGSILAAATNLNSPVVLLQDASGPSGFWQGGEFAWIRINGNGSNQSSPASCVQIVQPADAGSAHNYEVKSCGSYGVEFDGVTSGTTGMYDVSIFSGLAGGAVYFNGAVSSMVLDTFHVGGNVGPAITCKAGAGGFGLVLNGFQIEGLSVASAASPTAILIDETTSICQVAGWGLSASSVISGTDYIERVNGVSTSLPSVNLENVLLSSGNYTNLFHDNVNSYVVPLSSVQSSASSPISVWHNNMEARQLGAIALQPATLTLGNGANANVKLSTSGGGSNGYAESHFIVSGPTAVFSISGFVGGGGFSTGSVDGHFVILENPTSFAMTLTNLDSGSTSGNQILTGTGSNVTLSAGQSAILMYNVATAQWHLISAGTGGGGGTPSSPTLSFQYNNGGVFGGITPATTNGLYYPVENVTANVATAPQLFQVGMGGRAITGASSSDLVAYSDNGTVIDHDIAGSASVTETLPTATTLLNPAFVFSYTNHSSHTDTISPSTWTIQSGNSAAASTLSVAAGIACRIKVDPNSSTNWLADCSNVGGGTVTTTGSPASGNLTQFSGSTSITNGNLSGDCSTSGTLSVTCTKINGIAFPASAAVISSNSSAQPVAATTTGSGTTVVLATSPTLVTPALGTPASGVLTNATGLPLSGHTTQVADTVVMNASGSTAVPTAVVMPTCAASGHADVYDPSTHTWTCNSISGAAGVVLVPATTAANTIAPTANSVVGLTITQSTGTGTPDSLDLQDSGGHTIATFNSGSSNSLAVTFGNGSGPINSSLRINGLLSINPNGNTSGGAIVFNSKGDEIQGGSSANNNISGIIAVASSTTGTFTFLGQGYSSTPTCVVSPIGDPTAVGVWWVTATNTVLTVHVKVSGTLSFNYVCIGQPN